MALHGSVLALRQPSRRARGERSGLQEGLRTVTVASEKARMCRERAAVARQQADTGLSLQEREAGRAAEQQWLRNALLYQLMDEVNRSLGLAGTDPPQN